MTTYTMTVDEFMAEIAGELELQVDEMILAQSPEYRPMLLANRELILEKLTAATRQANEQHRAMPWLRYRH
jgi:hypothetical protein